MGSCGEGIYSDGLVLYEDLVVNFILGSDLDGVLGSATTLLFDVSRESETGRAATGVSAFVAP